MTLQEMIDVLEAAKAGRRIQEKIHWKDEWIDKPEPPWAFSVADYRVKPEPREWDVAVSSRGRIYVAGTIMPYPEIPREHIKVREVLE